MSCDFGVWYPYERLSNKAAGELYIDLCEATRDSPRGHPSVDAFYQELVASHPEIDTVSVDQLDDKDYCPWSCAFDRSEGHIIMSCIWPQADKVQALLVSLSRKHGLALYDPQSERIIYPDEPSQIGSKPWWKLW